MTGLGDILGGNDDDGQTAPPEPAVPPQRDPAPAEAPRRDPEPRRTGDDDAAPPAAPGEPEAQHVPIAALRDERTKRQALEQRFAEMERKYQALEQGRAQAEAPRRPDLFENPDGALDFVQQQFQQQLQAERLNWSVASVSAQHEDYAQAEEAFIARVKSDPAGAALYQRMLSDPNPASFAYREGKKALALGEIGDDPDGYRAKVRAEIEAELRAQMGIDQQREAVDAKRRQIPPSLATARDTSGRFAPVEAPMTPLQSILAPRR